MVLNLNVSKCEVISRDQRPHEVPIEGFTRINTSGAVLLGAHLGPRSALEAVLEARCSDLRIAIGRFKNISAHDALILPPSLFSVPRLMHTLRFSPSDDHNLLEIHDDLLREVISVIINSFLSDLQWLQASFPIREGDLGAKTCIFAGTFCLFGFRSKHV